MRDLIIVLNSPTRISDMLVYMLGLRDTNELTEMVTKIMSGEGVEINNEPLTLTYEDLMNVELKLIRPTDFYKYNSKYKIYEDMSKDEKFIENLNNTFIPFSLILYFLTVFCNTNKSCCSYGISSSHHMHWKICVFEFINKIYPEYAKTAEEEGFTEIANKFQSNSNKVALIVCVS